MTQKEKSRLDYIDALYHVSSIALIGFVLCQGLALYVWVMGRGFGGVFAWQFFATICLGVILLAREETRRYERELPFTK